ncbi:hypothetical protein [Leptospira bouyouniensis]|uniref:Tetratricopeptide repeat protein n=1 Tax=Leptospira bouyouniensis TaxID=2484911 RepID=A0ABY2KZ97_9LEPT|nr:hypothetical protein [Leptospira bouyouniensis]TGK45921.1 hypothetical protein EHQ10_18630 [Leptospira bouyouniensis]
MKKITYTFLLLLCLSLSAESISEEDIFLFRYSLKNKQFEEANDLLSKFQLAKIDQAKYELLETEYWISKGEDLYQQKKYKSSFEFYNKAHSRWRTNPLIKERYSEMSGKILHDEEEQKTPIPTIIPRKIQEKEKEVVYINSNADSYFLINSFRITEIEEQTKLIYALLGSIAILFLIQVIINLILLIRK